MSVISQGMKCGRFPVLSSISSTNSEASERWTKATLAPWRRKPSVSAAPMPEPPPVMKTERFARSGKVGRSVISVRVYSMCISCAVHADRSVALAIRDAGVLSDEEVQIGPLVRLENVVDIELDVAPF